MSNSSSYQLLSLPVPSLYLPPRLISEEDVTISVLVINTGDLTGTYEVTLKIDNVTVASKDVTLAGGASQTVTFTTAKDAAGVYTIDVEWTKRLIRRPGKSSSGC